MFEAFCGRLWQGRFSLLVDMRQMRYVDREARAVYRGGTESGTQPATALLVRSPATRVIANFFIGLNGPKGPIRIFNDEATAIAWAAQYTAPPTVSPTG